MRSIKLLSIVFILFFSTYSNSINLSKGKGLACEAILCAIGIAIPASHSECKTVLKNWSLYLISHPWDSTPKCPKTDAQSNIVGYIEMKCESIQDLELKNQCIAATNGGGDEDCGLGDPELCQCIENGQPIPNCQIN